MTWVNTHQYTIVCILLIPWGSSSWQRPITQNIWKRRNDKFFLQKETLKIYLNFQRFTMSKKFTSQLHQCFTTDSMWSFCEFWWSTMFCQDGGWDHCFRKIFGRYLQTWNSGCIICNVKSAEFLFNTPSDKHHIGQATLKTLITMNKLSISRTRNSNFFFKKKKTKQNKTKQNKMD
jgi:hypothetical protein